MRRLAAAAVLTAVQTVFLLLLGDLIGDVQAVDYCLYRGPLVRDPVDAGEEGVKPEQVLGIEEVVDLLRGLDAPEPLAVEGLAIALARC